MQKWVEFDRKSALGYFEALPTDSPFYEQTAAVVLGERTQSNPSEALRLADEWLAGSDWRRPTKEAAIEELYRRAPDEALAHLRDELDSEMRDALVSKIAPLTVAEDGGESAMELARAIGGLGDRGAAELSVFSRWIKEDSTAAGDWLLANPEAINRESMLRKAATTAARNDINEGLAWIGAMANGEGQHEAAEKMMGSRWARLQLPSSGEKIAALKAAGIAPGIVEALAADLLEE